MKNPITKPRATKFAKTLGSALPYLVFGMALFFVTDRFFGRAESLLSFIFLFYARQQMAAGGLSVKNHLFNALPFFLAALAATLTSLGPVVLVLMNCGFLFFIIFTYADDFAPRNYFLIGLEFMMLQIFPMTMAELPQRLAAVAFAFAATTLFVQGMKRAHKGAAHIEKRTQAVLHDCFAEVSAQLTALCTGDVRRAQADRLSKITTSFCQAEYPNTFQQLGLMSPRQKYFFAILLAAEQLGQVLAAAGKHDDGSQPAEAENFRRLARLFAGYTTEADMAKNLRAFLVTAHFHTQQRAADWAAALQTVCCTLESDQEKHSNETKLRAGIVYRAHHLAARAGIHHMQFRFALQAALIIGAGTLLALALEQSGFQHTYWITLSAYSMLYTYADDTVQDVLLRIAGTLVGAVFFVVATQWFPVEIRLAVALLIGFLGTLASKSVLVKMAGSTQMSMSVLYAHESLAASVFTRIMFVIMGALVVLLGVAFVLRMRRSATIKSRLVRMAQTDQQLYDQAIGQARAQKPAQRHVAELLNTLHLSSALLLQLSSGINESDRAQLQRLVHQNHRFTTAVMREFSF